MRKLIIKATKSKTVQHCYHLEFRTHYEMCLAFVRIQEFYESPCTAFRSKYFSLEEYMTWYAKKYGSGVFTYPDDWDGFNVPSHILGKFLRMFRDLRPWEQEVFAALKTLDIDIAHIDCDKREFYVIGTTLGDKVINFQHELCHGLFYMNSDYRREVEKIVGKCKLQKFRKRLLQLGYVKSVINDEIQAYLITEPACNSQFKMTQEIKTLRRKLRSIYRKTIGGCNEFEGIR